MLAAVACPSANLCAAIDASAQEVAFDPGSPGTPTPVSVDPNGSLQALACPATSQCTAIDGVGDEITFDPASPGTPTLVPIDSNGVNVSAVDCPSVSQCTAVDWSGQEVTFDPTSPSTPAAIQIDSGNPLMGVACPSVSQCVAIDQIVAAVSFDPNAPATPTPVALDADSQSFLSTAGACPSASQCTVVGTPFGSSGASAGQDGDGQEVTLTSGGPAGSTGASGASGSTGASGGSGANGSGAKSRPDTLLGRDTIQPRRGEARFSFRARGDATGFQCALVRMPRGKQHVLSSRRYARCKTPKTYAHLAAGSYIFYVRAIGPGGIDTTPARRRFIIAGLLSPTG